MLHKSLVVNAIICNFVIFRPYDFTDFKDFIDQRVCFDAPSLFLKIISDSLQINVVSIFKMVYHDIILSLNQSAGINSRM